METRSEIAAQKKLSGRYSCSQAVLTSYPDLTGLDEETAMNAAAAFSAGMGNMEGTCGALTGAGIVLGLYHKDKVKAMKAMRQVMTQFQAQNGATQCRLLKGVGTGRVLRECHDCVADAARFLEATLTPSE